MVATILNAGRLATDMLQLRSTIRIGITGLAQAGKTALLTSLAANLLAVSSGQPALPAVSDRLRGRRLRVGDARCHVPIIPATHGPPSTRIESLRYSTIRQVLAKLIALRD